PLPPVGGGVWERLWPWTLGVVLVGVLGFLIWVYPRVVRKRPLGLEGPSTRPAFPGVRTPLQLLILLGILLMDLLMLGFLLLLSAGVLRLG
ncbi:hypothetical protein, partial [Thermoflexus sp.]|uniref:hypothetical protein n=1 Tax=Thermoflexus sp. TaxID=1969742 RepID=UPI003C057BB5